MLNPVARCSGDIFLTTCFLTRHPLLAVLGQAIGETLPGGRELSELVSDHFLGYSDWDIVLAVVYLELEAHKGGNDRTSAGVGPDGDIVGQSLLETRQGHKERAFPRRARHARLVESCV